MEKIYTYKYCKLEWKNEEEEKNWGKMSILSFDKDKMKAISLKRGMTKKWSNQTANRKYTKKRKITAQIQKEMSKLYIDMYINIRSRREKENEMNPIIFYLVANSTNISLAIRLEYVQKNWTFRCIRFESIILML